MGANARIETLTDLIRQNGNVLVACSCGHRSIVDARRLARWYACHGWTTRIAQIGTHLKCSRCGKRPATISNTYGAPTGPPWGPVTDADWQKLVKRLRD